MVVAAEWIFPVTSPPLRKHAIVVENGRIQEIRPLQRSEVPALNSCIVPGFVNAHTHLAYTGLRNVYDSLPFFSWIRKLTDTKYKLMTDEDILRSTMMGIAESLRAGITTVADMSDLEVSLKALSGSPLRGVFYWEIFGVEKEAADETWRGLDEKYRRLRSEYSTERLKLGISPHACYTVRPELYSRVADWAFKENVPVSFHVSESSAEEEFIGRRGGVIADFLRERASDWQFLGHTSIEHLAKTGIFETKPLVAHAVHASSTDLDLLSKNGVSVAHCPKSNAKFGHGIAPVCSMLDRDIRVAIGTDSASSNNRLDLFEEGRFALLQQRAHQQKNVISEQKILEMLTIEGSRALDLDQEIGSLEQGKWADFVLIRIPEHYTTADQILNHLIHNSSSADVLKTFIGGKEAVVDFPDLRDLYGKLQ